MAADETMISFDDFPDIPGDFLKDLLAPVADVDNFDGGNNGLPLENDQVTFWTNDPFSATPSAFEYRAYSTPDNITQQQQQERSFNRTVEIQEIKFQKQPKFLFNLASVTIAPEPKKIVVYQQQPLNEHEVPSVVNEDQKPFVGVEVKQETKEEEEKRKKRQAVQKCRSNKKIKLEQMEKEFDECKAEKDRLIKINVQLKNNNERLEKERQWQESYMQIAAATIKDKDGEIRSLKNEIERMKNDPNAPNDGIQTLICKNERLEKELFREKEWIDKLTVILRDYQRNQFD